MVSAYRDEVEALRARAEAAEAELRRLKGETPPRGEAPEPLSKHVAPGDRIVRWGRPVVWRLVLARSGPLCVLGAAWLGIFFLDRALPAVVFEAHLASGVLLGAIGVWNVHVARRTWWALTEREAIVVTTVLGTRVRRIVRERLGDDTKGDVVVQMIREAIATEARAA